MGVGTSSASLDSLLSLKSSTEGLPGGTGACLGSLTSLTLRPSVEYPVLTLTFISVDFLGAVFLGAVFLVAAFFATAFFATAVFATAVFAAGFFAAGFLVFVTFDLGGTAAAGVFFFGCLLDFFGGNGSCSSLKNAGGAMVLPF